MFTWAIFILTCLDFVPMILFSLVLFRQKIKPHGLPIALAFLAGMLVTYLGQRPILYICIICVLLVSVWRFFPIPAVILALSGYILSVIVSTGVYAIWELTPLTSYAAMKNKPDEFVIVLLLVLGAKCGILAGIHKLRLGFTFLTHYTRIMPTKENAGFYLFIIVVIVGIIYRHSYPNSVLSALMPIQLLGIATALFIYVMLGKELSFQR
ncbi:hypothetical protein P5G65_36025 [Paenibacillus chondroitinus]|uniref:Uncharacterized protein n=1 Tax=Paenibacillus chondroitinus TaxID=59842 RepID=A0ABU6DNB6_9BACL|nr:hypothetical protein [Paenibacillus chondroitinus]MEB4799275.1 hypothetical protein [Paenibacillus chondroitinus]